MNTIRHPHRLHSPAAHPLPFPLSRKHMRNAGGDNVTVFKIPFSNLFPSSGVAKRISYRSAKRARTLRISHMASCLPAHWKVPVCHLRSASQLHKWGVRRANLPIWKGK